MNEATVRTLVNMWLGFLAHIPGHGGSDGLRHIAQVSSLFVYWEVFAYALRLYGWGPVYASLTFVLRELLALKPTEIIKEAPKPPTKNANVEPRRQHRRQG